MATLSAFLSQNATPIVGITCVVSDRFKDPKTGEPASWEIRTITIREEEALRKECTKRVPVPGRRGQFQKDTDLDMYHGKLAVACTASPDLHNKELQDSYGAMDAETLLKTMLTPGEYVSYLEKINEVTGYDKSLQEEVDEAKN